MDSNEGGMTRWTAKSFWGVWKDDKREIRGAQRNEYRLFGKAPSERGFGRLSCPLYAAVPCTFRLACTASASMLSTFSVSSQCMHASVTLCPYLSCAFLPGPHSSF